MSTHVTTAIALLRNVSYKPGWDFRFSPNEFQANTITMNMWVTCKDSRNPDNLINVTARHDIRVYPDTELMELIDQVWQGLKKCELHEIDEWLRYNGELISDPHAKNSTSP